LLVFDPWRSVILVVAGDKSGQWEKWYRTAIPRAEQLYDDYLAERRKEMSFMNSVSRWRDSGHLERAVATGDEQLKIA
jgi:Phage derived protein Gp49-like (DUF891)